MILYNVTVNIDLDVSKEWLDWMKKVHIPDVLATGLFLENKIARIHAEEEGGISYSIQYLLKNWEDYNTYQSEYAAELQKDHQDKYAHKCVAFRTVLEIIHTANP
jgi:pyruvoyl-dependent arginine decarboxylase (PvlArgDC)